MADGRSQGRDGEAVSAEDGNLRPAGHSGVATMLDLSVFNNRPWLLDPAQLRLAVAKLNGFKTCYTLREVAEEHKRRMDVAREASSRAVRASSGKVAQIGIY